MYNEPTYMSKIYNLKITKFKILKLFFFFEYKKIIFFYFSILIFPYEFIEKLKNDFLMYNRHGYRYHVHVFKNQKLFSKKKKKMY